MKIAHEKSDDLNAVINVEITPEDYNPQVDKAIKDQAKKAKLPGFRPGMVPASHIKRTFGKSILFDEINRLVSEKINGYIDEQQLEILGQPLPVEDENESYNWDFNDTFSFKYEIGLAPDFKSPFTEKSVFTEYNIQADEKTLEERMKSLRRSYGKMSNPDVSEDEDVLYSELIQLDAEGNEMEDGLTKAASLRIDLVEDKKIKKSLIGLKKEDELTIDLKKAYQTSDLTRMLGITEEEIENLSTSTFKVTVKNVNRLQEADLNEEFYTKLFGEGTVKDEEGFKNKVKEEIEGMFVQNANQKLQNDLYLKGMEDAKLELPNEFLKKWLKATNPEIKEDELEEGFNDFIKNLQWTLIENKLMKDHQIEVKYEDVLGLAKERIAAQIQLYGQGQVPEDQELNQYAIQFLQDKEQANRLFEEVKALKVFDFLKTFVKIGKKDIAYDKFLALN